MINLEHIPVFYEGQDDLIEILATSMASVCYNTKSFINFYILDCGIHDFNKKQLEKLRERFSNFSIEYIYIDLNQFKDLKGYRVQNFVDCYSRLLIPELKKDIDRAIYLDTDTILLKDIKNLWDEDLHGKSLGAIPDLGYRKNVKDRFVNDLNGDPNQLYISGGVWIADCKKWRQNKTTKALLQLAKEKKEKLCFIIEDLFSLYFKTDYQLLDSRYAFIELDNKADDIPVVSITSDYLKKELENVVILHLAGDNKMWKYPYNIFTHNMHSHFDNFWFFAKMTPFYEGMQNKYIFYCAERFGFHNSVVYEKDVRLFNLFTILTIRKRLNNLKIYLFKYIPLLRIRRK